MPAIALIGSFGGALTMATAVPFDPTWSDEEFYSQEFGTWVYATDGVSVNSTGTGCTDPGSLIAYTVDVDLVAGWNQLAWTYDLDASTTNFSSFNLRNTSTTVWHLFPMLR